MEDSPYEDLLRRLTALVITLDSTYDALLESNRQQGEFNKAQIAINQDVRTTLARVETLLARMLRQDSGNGREA